MSARTLKALLGDYPVTAALKRREVRSDSVRLEFADVRPPSAGFKRVVRDLEFDLAELAITTFLIAKSFGKPLRLLPVVLVGRLQHSFLVHNAERGPLAPENLPGKRVGVRSYSVTTGMWIRGILAEDHGVDPRTVTWVTFEQAHVAEFRDPPNVERAPAGKDLIAMLLAGEIDAAIVGDGKPADPRIRPVIADPEAAARAWRARTGAIQINHMAVVREPMSTPESDEIFQMLLESRRAAGNPELNPCGLEENRRNLEVAIDYVHRQGLIPRRYAVEELFR
jgi:4,5-dihydroxyphthalate decarboxylase